MNLNKIYTNNSIMDNIVYYLKNLVFNTVLKRNDKANEYETIESIKNSDIYISLCEYKVDFNFFDKFPLEILVKVLGENHPLLNKCLENKEYIPKNKRDVIVEETRLYEIKKYQDLNNYYKELHGVPNDSSEYILLSDYYHENIIENNRYIHDLSNSEIDTLEKMGIIQIIINSNPHLLYLNHLGSKSISYYLARKANKFDILFVPDISMENIRELFMNKLMNQIDYTMKVVYSEAFKFGSDYYDEFIEMFIKIQAMVETVIDLPELFIRQDFFDRETMNEIFVSNGLPTFDSIPSKYRKAMIQNLNTLIKYKSSNRNVIDICNLFGFNNIEVFQYYILKNRKMDKDGNFILEYEKEPLTGNLIEDYSKNYSLSFLKVPIGKNINDYIFNNKNIISYDAVTSQDYYWNGDEDPVYIKNKILEKDFNIERSKYMSINTLYDMNILEFEFCYLFNTIIHSKNEIKSVSCKVKEISNEKSFRIIDLVAFLFYTMYAKYEIEDSIFNDPEIVLEIKGFNFEADLNYLSEVILNNGYSNKDFMLDDFKIPSNRFLTFDEILDVYLSNKKVYNHLNNVMKNTDSFDEYRIYKQIFDSLMICKANNDVFYINELGRIANTYSEFLKYNDPILYDIIERVENKNLDETKVILNEVSVNIIFALESLIKNDSDFKYIFHSIPSITIYPISTYIYQILSFFKSYMIDITNISNSYCFKNEIENKIKIYDKINKIKSRIYFDEISNIQNKIDDTIIISNKYVFKDYISPRDDFYIDKEEENNEYF